MGWTNLQEEIGMPRFTQEQNAAIENAIALWEIFDEDKSVENAINALQSESQIFSGNYPGEDSEPAAIEIVVEFAAKQLKMKGNVS